MVKAPGTANNATFLPLKISSVVFHAGPSAVITRNFVSGSRSPTLMGMTVILSLQLKPQREHQISAAGGLFQRQAQSSGAATSMASSAVTAVTVTTAPSYFTPGGAPSRSKAKRRSPPGASPAGLGSGSAQSVLGPSTNRS